MFEFKEYDQFKEYVKSKKNKTIQLKHNNFFDKTVKWKADYPQLCFILYNFVLQSLRVVCFSGYSGYD